MNTWEGALREREKRWPSLTPRYIVWLEGQQEREKGHPNPAGSPMGIPIRWEPGNRGKTPDRAVGSPGHLGHLTDTRSAGCTYGVGNVGVVVRGSPKSYYD